MPGSCSSSIACTAYLLAILAIVVWRRARRSPHAATRFAGNAMLAMLALQVLIGIMTALYSAPLPIALVHQLGAVALWVLILRLRFLARYPVRGHDPGWPMTAYDELARLSARDRGAGGQVAGRLGWDQETMMPDGRRSAARRGACRDGRGPSCPPHRPAASVSGWPAAEPPDEAGAAMLRHVRRDFERTTKVPARLGAEIARTTSLAHRVWARGARRRGRARLPAARCARVVDAAPRGGATACAGEGRRYDALLDDYEPGASSRADRGDVRRAAAAARRAAGRGSASGPAPPALPGTFSEAGQLALSRELALAFGYDLTHGRIDKAVHPFSSGSGLDVRITTRTNPLDPFNCFYSTIHEVGHATYEQGVDAAYLLTPLGSGVSMGVHESQSRIYENQFGRSRAFTGWLFGRMRDHFGDFGIADADAFYACVNRVTDGYIRTEADEVQYNLHVLLRFDLERALIAGDLQVADLEAAWNDRFLADFGFAVDRPSHGVLQDVHWSEGLFGYFPTYTLGNVYAGLPARGAAARTCRTSTRRSSQGDTARRGRGCASRLQRWGGLHQPRETMRRACGAEPSEAPLLDYLEAKFGALYGL